VGAAVVGSRVPSTARSMWESWAQTGRDTSWRRRSGRTEASATSGWPPIRPVLRSSCLTTPEMPKTRVVASTAKRFAAEE